MADNTGSQEPPQDKGKAKIEDVSEDQVAQTSQPDQREELDPRQVQQMLKMLGLSADAVTIPGTVSNITASIFKFEV
jgi:hypothetical protein